MALKLRASGSIRPLFTVYTNTGLRVLSYVYDAWGNCTTVNNYDSGVDSGSAPAYLNPFRYRGYYYDNETGFYYLQSRYYDPAIGRFLNADSHVSTETGLPGYNMYAYCNNNPAMGTDPTGEFFFNFIISIVSYAVMAVATLFDEDIRNDMNNIGWNPFNDDETTVIDSKKVSFYKGAPVFRGDYPDGRSFSFGALFLDNGLSNANTSSNGDPPEETVKHEWGHTIQLGLLGPINYGLGIGIPSCFGWSRKDYYDRPWEVTADLFGGVQRQKPASKADINFGLLYLATASLDIGLTSWILALLDY